jgi:hypothetical protein
MTIPGLCAVLAHLAALVEAAGEAEMRILAALTAGTARRP